jgi:hypothetical protein
VRARIDVDEYERKRENQEVIYPGKAVYGLGVPPSPTPHRRAASGTGWAAARAGARILEHSAAACTRVRMKLDPVLDRTGCPVDLDAGAAGLWRCKNEKAVSCNGHVGFLH